MNIQYICGNLFIMKNSFLKLHCLKQNKKNKQHPYIQYTTDRQHKYEGQ